MLDAIVSLHVVAEEEHSVAVEAHPARGHSGTPAVTGILEKSLLGVVMYNSVSKVSCNTM